MWRKIFFLFFHVRTLSAPPFPSLSLSLSHFTCQRLFRAAAILEIRPFDFDVRPGSAALPRAIPAKNTVHSNTSPCCATLVAENIIGRRNKRTNERTNCPLNARLVKNKLNSPLRGSATPERAHTRNFTRLPHLHTEYGIHALYQNTLTPPKE